MIGLYISSKSTITLAELERKLRFSDFTLVSFVILNNSSWGSNYAIKVSERWVSVLLSCIEINPSIWIFFLELFLHWSPVACWALINLRVQLSVSYLFAFSYYSWGSQGKNTEMVCHSISSSPHFVRTLHHDPSVLGGPTQHDS